MSNSKESPEPRILDYGPVRLIGIGRVCKSPSDCHNVWADETGLMARVGEIQMCAGKVPYYGLCRCVMGAENGAFEYIAAVPASENAPVPDGMIEVVISAGTYVEFPVAGLDVVGEAWGRTGEWLAANPQWKGFCDGNPDGCGCIANPSFELYPSTFEQDGKLLIYMPILPSA